MLKTTLVASIFVFKFNLASAQDQCGDIFIKTEHFSEGELLVQLESLNNTPFTPQDWIALGQKNKNLNPSFLIPRSHITAVVKFGDRVHEMEPLAYEIAKLLQIDMPLTIPIRMGEELGIAQVFLPNTKTLLEVGADVEVNVAIRMFDRLTLQSDRNYGNILVEANNVWSWFRDQTPIDHEFVFNRGDKSVDDMIKRGPNGFLLENMQKLKAEFPQVHRAFLDPTVSAKVISLVEANRGVSEREVDYVKKFFRAYVNIARLYDSETSARQ